MYKHKEIENKWQKKWEETNAFATSENNDKKYYVLDMFPYPSGAGLHVGHPEGYTATDIIARFKRLNGFDVLHPIGWDAFGLPAEQYALKTGNHPKEFTRKNIDRFREQLKSLGFSYDYSKEVDTTDPAYYKTTQWIFNQIYKKGLAEIRDIEVNWCPELGTGLANEEVVTLADGTRVSEVGSFPVFKKPMKQWVMKITKYADKLFDDLNEINWPSSLKSLQRNWIRNEDGTLHLQDWIFSRQRYWGEPFPIAFDVKTNEILLIEDLPIFLPDLDEIKPSGTGESPLANAKDWLFFEQDGKTYRRETNTMPQWAGSCWYYLAYILKKGDTYIDINSPEAKQAFKKWLPVDLYVGGQEHAVLHLLYARFWHKILFDLGIVPTKEPFFKIVNQGMILGTDGQKMSKSRGNVINPDEIVASYGADSLRMYEMFMGPLEETKAWTDEGIKGINRFIERVIRAFTEVVTIDKVSSVESEYNELIQGLTLDVEALKFNTAISKFMVFINALYKSPKISLEEIEGFLIAFSLFAPHISEELLEHFKLKQIKDQKWPIYSLSKIKPKQVEIAVQINGKLRDTLIIQGNETKEEIIALAKTREKVARTLIGVEILKEIFVPNKIVNFVVKK